MATSNLVSVIVPPCTTPAGRSHTDTAPYTAEKRHQRRRAVLNSGKTPIRLRAKVLMTVNNGCALFNAAGYALYCFLMFIILPLVVIVIE